MRLSGARGNFCSAGDRRSRGQGLGAFAGGWEGADSGVMPHFLPCVPSRSSHYWGVFPSELGFQRSELWGVCGVNTSRLGNPGAGHWPLGGYRTHLGTPVRERTPASSSETMPRSEWTRHEGLLPACRARYFGGGLTRQSSPRSLPDSFGS